MRAWLIILLLALAAPLLHAQDVLPVPTLSGRVIDQTGTLNADQRGALEAKLAAFEASAGSQLVVLIVNSTQPEDIASYAQRVGDEWKIGRRSTGDGVLLVVAKGDRHVRIEVAKALEGAVPDLAARQIIDSAIRPAFKANDYAGGLNAAVDQLSARIKTEGLPVPTADDAQQGFQIEELAMFMFIAVPIAGAVLTGIFGRKLGSLITAGGAGTLAWWFTASLMLAGVAAVGAVVVVGLLGIGAAARGSGLARASRGGWGGWSGGDSSGSGGGGGFSSGGGGDFGGGGASGDW